MHALLDEAQSVMAARHYEIPRSMKLAQRSLQTLDELGVDSEQDMAGAYARVVLSTSDYTLEPIRKLLNRTRYAHKRTARRPTNSRFSCTIGCECYAFLPTNQESFPQPNAVPDASALQELVQALVRRDAVCGQCVSDNWLQ
jgi:hypothetical protein